MFLIFRLFEWDFVLEEAISAIINGNVEIGQYFSPLEMRFHADYNERVRNRREEELSYMNGLNTGDEDRQFRIEEYKLVDSRWRALYLNRYGLIAFTATAEGTMAGVVYRLFAVVANLSNQFGLRTFALLALLAVCALGVLITIGILLEESNLRQQSGTNADYGIMLEQELGVRQGVFTLLRGLPQSRLMRLLGVQPGSMFTWLLFLAIGLWIAVFYVSITQLT